MPAISVFEPALCCNTGVCGEDVDANLVTFSADMVWLLEQGAAISRHNLANDPVAFAHSAVAKQFLEVAGSEGLPLVCVDDVTVLTGRYPTRAELSRWAALDAPVEGLAGVISLGLSDASSTQCCPPGQSDCC
ncbi:arsenite efflux transporter metallochaperone ArsD (plasmid) [Mycolicibacterium crocinum]|uniref:Arsenic resistance operon repressor n=2 Tax=Mycolicibacterium TaxID=1866885 RepID=A0A064CDV8_9MYCO|nr:MULTISPECIES: arsenite efflux transporter metallochaperone ArsD [Mycolicibacterium]KDE96942.1 arsenic resistance operon repressor [Mycolicibacterium aromaticivorans JS19b1 = JCM 16368]ULN44782.1 arsenite efflux transporter metallochaperone ArsD [Mycolicibacterium crocinum]